MVSEPEGRIVVPVWVDDDVVKALIDDSGNMPVSIQNWIASIDVRITGSTITVPVSTSAGTSSVQGQMYGWKTSSWYKQAMLWGYSGRISQYADVTSSGAGSFYAMMASPPTGWIYVYYAFSAYHNDTVARVMSAGVYNGVSHIKGKCYQNATPAIWYGDPIDFVVAAGEQFEVGCYLGAAGKQIIAYGLAYSMEVSA